MTGKALGKSCELVHMKVYTQWSVSRQFIANASSLQGLRKFRGGDLAEPGCEGVSVQALARLQLSAEALVRSPVGRYAIARRRKRTFH